MTKKLDTQPTIKIMRVRLIGQNQKVLTIPSEIGIQTGDFIKFCQDGKGVTIEKIDP